MSSYRIDAGFPPFLSEYKSALKKFRTFKSDLISTFEILEKNPEAGDRMKYAESDVFKIRIGIKGSGIGKSGGYRLIYLVDSVRSIITPLALYFKRDVENIGASELSVRLGKLAKFIEEDPTLLIPPPPSLPN